ncbi:hypothetical protein HMPREF1584_01038 [Gardnerella vaginalis JCP8481A]|nr:hypothetical protein HMPREF1584_01038 [Gardnerella vaginalis JCP8481A]EPI43499.1 hypothetical protein HMPREF1585_00488 [Gardnerella vaginalis JCP8481B]
MSTYVNTKTHATTNARIALANDTRVRRVVALSRVLMLDT